MICTSAWGIPCTRAVSMWMIPDCGKTMWFGYMISTLSPMPCLIRIYSFGIIPAEKIENPHIREAAPYHWRSASGRWSDSHNYSVLAAAARWMFPFTPSPGIQARYESRSPRWKATVCILIPISMSISPLPGYMMPRRAEASQLP